MAHNLVNRDASWESNTLLHVLGLLGSISLFALSLDHLVDSLAHGVDVSAWNAQFDGLGKAS